MTSFQVHVLDPKAKTILYRYSCRIITNFLGTELWVNLRDVPSTVNSGVLSHSVAREHKHCLVLNNGAPSYLRFSTRLPLRRDINACCYISVRKLQWSPVNRPGERTHLHLVEIGVVVALDSCKFDDLWWRLPCKSAKELNKNAQHLQYTI